MIKKSDELQFVAGNLGYAKLKFCRTFSQENSECFASSPSPCRSCFSFACKPREPTIRSHNQYNKRINNRQFRRPSPPSKFAPSRLLQIRFLQKRLRLAQRVSRSSSTA